MKLLVTVALLLAGLGARAQAPSVRTTDSSRIETKFYPGGKQVKEYLTAKDRVYYRFHRNNQTRATSTATQTKAGRPIGVSKEYDDQGQLLYTIDHDAGTWTVADLRAYPFDALQMRLKRRADALIATQYGTAFLRRHAVWNVDGSAIYNAKEAGNWTDKLTLPPTRFLFRYDVKLDADHVYPELIEFELDAQGKFLPNDSEVVYGFEQLPQVPVKGFGLVYHTAVVAARKRSGTTTEPLTGFLQWENFRKATLFNGQFRFYVPIKTGSTEDLHPQGRSRVTDYYDVYSFNPWTGAFLEKKKMEQVREWEKASGFTGGLRPVK
jgi:hypothetical protein